MFIEPNSTIRLISNCPLDNTYEHTLYWDNIDAQYNYFNSIVKHRFDNQSYQNYSSGTMRINIQAENIYDCNYLMFQNTSFGNKWFYAFIKSVAYINNVTAEVEYELDVMQTWFFDYDLGECFVDREHSATDVIGENTIPENLEKGPYIVTQVDEILNEQLSVALCATELIAFDGLENVPHYSPSIIGGFPFPCYVYDLGTVNKFTPSKITALINAYTDAGKADAVISIFTFPSLFSSYAAEPTTVNFLARTGVLSATPKNKKLLTYPYICCVLCGAGNSVELRYELFPAVGSRPARTPEFSIRSTFGPSLIVSCTPNSYAGVSDDYEHQVTCSGWPICAWTSEYYQNWIAQNKPRFTNNVRQAIWGLGMSTFNGAVGMSWAGGIGAAVGGGLGAIGGTASLVNTVSNMVAEMEQAYIMPDQMSGCLEASNTDAVHNRLGFRVYCKSIMPEYVNIIDDYFTKFGYATHKLKKPNRNVRPHWCFTKTVACTLLGSLPADVSNKISAIYDNGITFWKNPSEVGNYSLDNSV